MSVYVGIDVHRKRSQVAVVTEDGQVQVNRNVVNGVEPILDLIGDLPSGTPVAFEAAYGWGWLVELLEDYGFDRHLVHPLRCKAIESARLKNDKVDAAILGQLLRVGTCCQRRGSRRGRCASCGRCCATGSPWCGWALSCVTGSTRWPPTTATTGPTGSGPAPTGQARDGNGWPNCRCRRCPGGLSPTASRSSTRGRRPSTDWTGRSIPGQRPPRRSRR
jgi:Transposase